MLSGDGTVVNSLTVYFIHAVVIKISAGGRSGLVRSAVPVRMRAAVSSL